MKRYLMRGGMSPLDTPTPEWVIQNNAIGANSGNLLYAFGVYRTLMTEDVAIDMDQYGVERKYTDKDIDRINAEYDAYICPLADAFRDAFSGKLEKYAYFFNRLTIPVYVIGLGVRIPYDGDVSKGFSFDREAKSFVKAVLRKSTILGLRGEITGTYMNHLGFREGIDYRVIGCPSLYTFGRELPQRPLRYAPDGTLSPDMKVSFNMSSITPEPVLQLLFKEMERFPEHYCVEQNEAELRLLYNGIRYICDQKRGVDTLLPLDTTHPLLVEDRYKFFIHPKPWFDFLRGMDLCVGSKLHGNVAGVLAGCPTLFITLDGRMRELTQYHSLPTLPYDAIQPDDTLESLIAQVDMRSHLRCHAENFDRYIQFLDDNGLEHIYKNDRNRKTAPVDVLLESRTQTEITSILNCSNQEIIQRFNRYNDSNRKKISSLKKECAVLKKGMPQTYIDVLKYLRTLKKKKA